MIFGIVGIPLILFVGMIAVSYYRDKHNLTPIHPQLLSLVVLLGTLGSWVTAGINIVIYVLRK